MPTIFFWGPSMEKDSKKRLVQAFTKAASEATGINESAFVVYLQSTSPSDVGVGGVLLEDRIKSPSK